ncbi:MAG: response regulator [Deltaproteobacteria bacterium]|nr:response regulator [Deltaproteobacteria bacterium]
MPKARVLAVDDQLYFRTFLEGLLAEEGYEVETAADGVEALHAMERDRFDLVITDLVMPEMDGGELIKRIKERWPDQAVVIVSGVGDVQTAVDAMKYGATEYLLKPIERSTLARTLEQILNARRLHRESEKLMQENLEYMGALSLYERAVGLFATLSLQPLAERTLEAFCIETGAQSGVLWVRDDQDSDKLRLVAARGLVQVAEEPEALDAERLPQDFGAGESLVVFLRHGGRLIGLVRLSDKLEGDDFGDPERALAQKAAELASVALANSLKLRSLERRSFRDPTTKAYTLAFFEDVVRNEIQKANRFGRSFALLLLELDGLARLSERFSAPELGRFLESLVFQVSRALRSTDLIASESEGRYRVLLPETDALGAAVLKRRIREALQAADLFEELSPDERPRLLLSAASYPADGTQVEILGHALEARLEDDRTTLLRSLDIEQESFSGAVDALLELARPGSPQTPEQVMRFAIDEVARRPRDRGLVFVSPGSGIPAGVRESLERLRGLQPRAEVVLVSDAKADAVAGGPVTCVSARRAGTRVPFVIYYGEGPAYALIRERSEDGDASPFFHTSDRSLVEHLAFKLQRDLGVSVGL